jgi:lipopolysaccharide transport system ATP-binding protein
MNDPSVILENVTLDLPVYDRMSFSLKSNLIRGLVGSGLKEDKGVTFIRALDGLSLTVRRGERVGLVGHNGAGKTTLLKTIAGIYEPTLGSVRTRGQITTLIDIAMGMNPEATGYENIIIRGLHLGHSLSEIQDRMDHIIAFSELGDYIGLPVRTYSMGMISRPSSRFPQRSNPISCFSMKGSLQAILPLTKRPAIISSIIRVERES